VQTETADATVLRIQQEDSSPLTTLRLDGQLRAATVRELLTACGPLLLQPDRLQLHLGGLTFVDPEGVQTLRRLMALGVAVCGASIFVQELLKEPPQ
jgi:hypothetical protein